MLKEEFITIGKYDTSSFITRMKQSLYRQNEFLELFEKKKPDVSISHQSVDSCRIAFGLGIPIIATHDSPHAHSVNKLTMSLIDWLVVSEAISIDSLKRCFNGQIFQFSGVDEVAWIQNRKYQIKYEYPRPLIIIREFETKAAYAQNEINVAEQIAEKLVKVGNVLYLPRYDRRSRDNLIIPDEFVDSTSLVNQADLVVGFGGTMAREAALQGIPTLVLPAINNQPVNDYLTKKGFPLFKVEMTQLISKSKKLINKRWKTKSLLEKLQNPINTIEKILQEKFNNH
jgi:predicted glycosyltransferase